MRTITTDIKALVSRLGPAAAKALEGAIRRAMSAEYAEVTTDHLLRALLDLPDTDMCVSMNEAGVARTDVAARLDWHIGRLKGSHKGKPSLSHGLCLLLEDAGKLTTERVRTGHMVAALLADPSLSSADIAGVLTKLPREPLYLLASRVEDRGEIGRTPAATPAAHTPAPAPAAPKVVAAAPAAAPRAPRNVKALRAELAARLKGEDACGLTLAASVGGRATTLRLEWDVEARVLVLRLSLPSDPPADEVGAAVALSTLNNALPHGAFVLDHGRITFRSHVFLDAGGDAPIETVVFATRVCELAAEALAEG